MHGLCAATKLKYKYYDFYLNLDSIAEEHLLENQLGNAIAFLDDKVLLTKVEENHANGTAVVIVDDTGTSVDKVLHSQARAGGHTAICAFRDGDADVGGDNGLGLGRDSHGSRARYPVVVFSGAK